MSASQRQVFYACDADGHIVQGTTIAMDDQSQIKDPLRPSNKASPAFNLRWKAISVGKGKRTAPIM